MSENALVPTQEPFSLAPQNMEQALQYAKLLAESSLVPQAFQKKSGDILVAVQLGMELGLSPVQALQNIAVINGRPCLWGDAVLALVRASGKLEYIKEYAEGDVAFCVVKRKGDPEEVTREFSNLDAEVAGLAKKAGPWQQYPGRMRQMRARSWAIRDVFPDVLKGVSVREEVEDYNVVSEQSDGTQIMRRPQRGSGIVSEERMAEFLNEGKPKAAGAGDRSHGEPKAEGRSSASPAPAAPSTAGMEKFGVIGTEEATTTQGAAYLKVKLAKADGKTVEASCFSETASNAIRQAEGAGVGLFAKVVSKLNQKDGKTYVNVTEAVAEVPGDEQVPA